MKKLRILTFFPIKPVHNSGFSKMYRFLTSSCISFDNDEKKIYSITLQLRTEVIANYRLKH